MKLERKENEVAEILVKLASQSGIFLPQRWGRKRKRSAVAVTPKPDSVSFSRRHHNHNHSKRKRYLKIIQGLTNDKHLLNREMKNVKCYFEKLKEYNLKLKARKQALCVAAASNHSVQKQPQWQFHPPFIHGNQFARGHSTTSFNGAGLGLGLGLDNANTNSNNHVGPIGIPDLNLPLQEPIASHERFDANANKLKNPMPITKPRFSCT